MQVRGVVYHCVEVLPDDAACRHRGRDHSPQPRRLAPRPAERKVGALPLGAWECLSARAMARASRSTHVRKRLEAMQNRRSPVPPSLAESPALRNAPAETTVSMRALCHAQYPTAAGNASLCRCDMSLRSRLLRRAVRRNLPGHIGNCQCLGDRRAQP